MTPTEAALRAAERLFATIAHGDDAHRAWLKAKLEEWFQAEALAAPPHGKDAGEEPKHLDDAFTVSLCVECGPNVGCDEDGCCSCGATCVGNWLEEHKPVEALIDAQAGCDALQARLTEAEGLLDKAMRMLGPFNWAEVFVGRVQAFLKEGGT
jgi:hypothetical protein